MLKLLYAHPAPRQAMADIDPDLLPTAQLLEQALQAEQLPPRRWLCRFGAIAGIAGLPELAKRYTALRATKMALMAGRPI